MASKKTQDRVNRLPEHRSWEGGLGVTVKAALSPIKRRFSAKFQQKNSLCRFSVPLSRTGHFRQR
jgi:hypothetical protein